MVRVVAFFAAIALLGAFITLVYAAWLRYVGRTIPRAIVRLAGGLVGAGHSLGFLFLPDMVLVGAFLGVPAFTTFDFLRRGHRVAAGLLLITLGLTGALWWGYFLVQDAVDPLVSYEAVIWLWWVPEPVLIVAGAFLLARGDRDVPSPPLIRKAPAHVRDPAPIGSAILRATRIGPMPIQVVVGIGVALVALTFGLPTAVVTGVPWPAGVLGGAVVFAVIGVELGYVAIPRRVRAAWQGHAVLGNPEMKRWVASTGTRVPTSVPAMRRWLKANPERPENRWARAQLLLITGDLAEARAVTERMPVDTGWERFEQHATRVYVDWVAGGDPDYEALRAHAEAVGEAGSQERFTARAEVAIAVARDLAVSGGDWMAPLIALRDEAGPAGQRLLRDDLRRMSYPWFLLWGLFASGFTLFASGLIR